MEVGKCKSCGAKITWAITGNGKRIPVDFAPDPKGNLVLEQRTVTEDGHLRDFG